MITALLTTRQIRTAFAFMDMRKLSADYATKLGKTLEASLDKIDWTKSAASVAKQTYNLTDDVFPPAVNRKQEIKALIKDLTVSRKQVNQEQWKQYWKTMTVHASVRMLDSNIIAHYYVFDMYRNDFDMGAKLFRGIKRMLLSPARWMGMVTSRMRAWDAREKAYFIQFLRASTIPAKAKILKKAYPGEKMIPDSSLTKYMKRHGVRPLPKSLLR